MPNFNNLDDLIKYLQNNPDEALKHSKEDYLNIPCPICNIRHSIKNLRNGFGLCEESNKEFEIRLDIKTK